MTIESKIFYFHRRTRTNTDPLGNFIVGVRNDSAGTLLNFFFPEEFVFFVRVISMRGVTTASSAAVLGIQLFTGLKYTFTSSGIFTSSICSTMLVRPVDDLLYMGAFYVNALAYKRELHGEQANFHGEIDGTVTSAAATIEGYFWRVEDFRDYSIGDIVPFISSPGSITTC